MLRLEHHTVKREGKESESTCCLVSRVHHDRSNSTSGHFRGKSAVHAVELRLRSHMRRNSYLIAPEIHGVISPRPRLRGARRGHCESVDDHHQRRVVLTLILSHLAVFLSGGAFFSRRHCHRRRKTASCSYMDHPDGIPGVRSSS